jgi:hypothetical protein
LIGGPDRDRTDDLFHAITTIVCNLLILGASVATLGILEHYWTTVSTFASTFNLRKEEVWRATYKKEGSDQGAVSAEDGYV